MGFWPLSKAEGTEILKPGQLQIASLVENFDLVANNS